MQYLKLQGLPEKQEKCFSFFTKWIYYGKECAAKVKGIKLPLCVMNLFCFFIVERGKLKGNFTNFTPISHQHVFVGVGDTTAYE